MLQLLLLAVAAIMLVWILFRLVCFGLSLYATPKELVLVPFESTTEEHKRLAPTILSAKLRELQSRENQVPTGYGFLNIPALMAPRAVDNITSSNTQVLADIQFKIKDVDVPALMRAVDAVFQPAVYELHGTIANLPTQLYVTARVTRRETVVGSWESKVKIPTGTASASPALLEEALDQILYQMIFDFCRKPEFKEWQVDLEGAKVQEFTNWQSLRACSRGLRALRSYQQTLDYTQLEEALRFFDSIAISDPDNERGAYFYGLALGENRQEKEAVAVFDQLLRLLERRGKKREQLAREARFHKACALLRHYDLKTAKAAVKELEELIAELDQEIAASSQALAKTEAEEAFKNASADRKAEAGKTLAEARAAFFKDCGDRLKLLIVADAQLGYSHGTILALPDLDEAQVPKHKTEKNTALSRAKLRLAELAGTWTSEQESQKRDVQCRIHNAEGYGMFREARFDNPLPADDAQYRSACTRAIKELDEANAERPNQYEVLQNLAMIYADSRFDPSKNQLPTARRLFERTQKFIPNDYYQYEQLALIAWREVRDLATADLADPLIKTGREHAKAALAHRENSGSARLLLARFARKEWDLSEHKDSGKGEAAVRAYGDAAQLRAERQSFREEFHALLRELAKQNQAPALLLNGLAERVLDLAEKTKDTAEKKTYAQDAVDWCGRSLKLTTPASGTQSTPEMAQLHEQAAKLEEQAKKTLSPAG